MSDGEMSQQLFRAEDNTALRFFTRAVKNNFRSEQEGRPIFDNGLYVEIITPGQNESVPEMLVERTFAGVKGEKDRKVERTAYYTRFQKQVEAFKANTGELTLDGTPLAKWPMIDAGTAATLRGMNVSTVEQLAEVTDGVLQNLGIGGRSLRDQAKSYIGAQDSGADSMKHGAEIATLKDEVKRLTAENDELRTALAAKPSVDVAAVADAVADEPEVVDPLAPAKKPAAKKATATI